VAAEAKLDALLGEEGTRSSEQAIAWTMSAKADARLAQGDPAGAFETAKEAWGHSGEPEMAYISAMFAAATMRDSVSIQTVRTKWRQGGAIELLPLQRGLDASAEALLAAIEGRWDEARAAFVSAERTFDEMGEALNLARLKLAVAGIAGDQLPEAESIGATGAAFFEERGAGHYVDAYRQTIARYAPAAPTRSSVGRSTPVRAGG
jgi:hypothetical protein